MGNVTLNGSTSGSITLSPPAVAGTNTLTLPAKTGNIITSADTGTVSQAMLATGVSGNGPSFSAFASSSQNISTATWTKIQCNTEEWDTANCFDNATNYRFTPNLAGYYQVSAMVAFANSITGAQCSIWKNGSAWKNGSNLNGQWAVVSCLVYLNGSTDYIEFYGAQVSGSTQATSANNPHNYFQAALVRAA